MPTQPGLGNDIDRDKSSAPVTVTLLPKTQPAAGDRMRKIKSPPELGGRHESAKSRLYWPEDELLRLREAVCRTPPSLDDVFWQSNNLWVGCTEICAVASFEPRSAVENLQIKIKAIGRDNDARLWDYYLARASQMRDNITKAGNGSRIEIVSLDIKEGCVEIITTIAILKAGITLGGLILSFMGAFANYHQTKMGFNDAVADCKAFVEKVVYRVKSFFDFLFGEDPGQPEHA